MAKQKRSSISRIFLIGLISFHVFIYCKEQQKTGSTPESRNSSPKYVASANGLILREKPTAKSKALARIEFKKQLLDSERSDSCEVIDGQKDCWYKLSINGKTGYVFGGYLSESEPKIARGFDRDVLNAPIKEIPETRHVYGWKKVSAISGIEFQVPDFLEFKLTSRKYSGKYYQTVERIISFEEFTYEDTALEKYCKTHASECATEAGPMQIQLRTISNMSIVDYMRLRIGSESSLEEIEILSRITKPWQGFFIKANDMSSEHYDFIFEKGKNTCVFAVRPSSGPDILKGPVPKSDVEKIFYSLRILP